MKTKKIETAKFQLKNTDTIAMSKNNATIDSDYADIFIFEVTTRKKKAKKK